MSSTRRERIEEMLSREPDDQFLRYGLAMELDKEADHERSLELLSGLMDDATPYVPAFFMAGQQLARIGRGDEAKAVIQRGIPEAQRQGNMHAAGEMTEFLASLDLLGDDDF